MSPRYSLFIIEVIPLCRRAAIHHGRRASGPTEATHTTARPKSEKENLKREHSPLSPPPALRRPITRQREAACPRRPRSVAFTTKSAATGSVSARVPSAHSVCDVRINNITYDNALTRLWSVILNIITAKRMKMFLRTEWRDWFQCGLPVARDFQWFIVIVVAGIVILRL